MKEKIKNVKKQLEEININFNKKLSYVSYSPPKQFSDINYRTELDKLL